MTDHHLLILLLAIILDMVVGDPDWLWRKFPHPVVGFGKVISILDQRLNRIRDNRQMRKKLGILALAIMLLLALVAGLLLVGLFGQLGLIGFAIEIVMVAVLIAQKSMSDHINAIIEPLSTGDIEGARTAVSMIVGRQTAEMETSDVTRSSIESLAENFSDGVVAPIFWYAILGLPGILMYKMLNTADSMIGHKTVEHEDFGWASAKLDDVANCLPARISALLIAMAALISLGVQSFKNAIWTVLNNASLHRSPNAGWPETAMAGALGIVLSGPRTYNGKITHEPYLNPTGRLKLTHLDLEAASKLFWLACVIEAVIVFFVLLTSVWA
ncbi:MAG: cobalamin biosynthesis protein [Rhizobiaceae bacterium]|nr:cobalamin biosynthesis protein [Rhizobiaceae bacterium]